MILRDQLIQKTARELSLPEDWVEKAVSHQFKQANRATLQHRTLEISGFGTFTLYNSKMKRKLDKLVLMQEALEKKEPTEGMLKKLEGIRETIRFYQAKLQ